MTGAPSPHPYLRLVPPAPPPRPRRIDVMISARAGAAPIGRAGPFPLTPDEFNEVIAIVTRMVRRRA